MSLLFEILTLLEQKVCILGVFYLEELLLVLSPLLCISVVNVGLAAIAHQRYKEKPRQYNQNYTKDPSPEEILPV